MKERKYRKNVHKRLYSDWQGGNLICLWCKLMLDLGLNPGQGMWESCQQLGISIVFSPGTMIFSTTNNYLARIKPICGRKLTIFKIWNSILLNPVPVWPLAYIWQKKWWWSNFETGSCWALFWIGGCRSSYISLVGVSKNVPVLLPLAYIWLKRWW